MIVDNHSTSAQMSFALDICQKAGEIAMKYFLSGLETVTKNDGSPVTVADKECEKLIRDSIKLKFPKDNLLGEEEGEDLSQNSNTSRKWIIDPIDGTYNYARGIPIFSTLLALEQDNEIVLGVIHAPATGETFWAEKGSGAYKNGKKLRVSNCADLKKAQFNFGGPGRILSLGYWDALTKVIASTGWQRCYGDYKNFAFVFEGQSEAALEVGLHPWDVAPMKIIAQEAGGCFSDLVGGSSIYKGSCLVSNKALHGQFLEMLTTDVVA